MRKWVPYIVIAVLAVAIFFIRKYSGQDGSEPGSSNKKQKVVNRDRGFDRRTGYLEYSRHALCRMDCRKISRDEVKEVMTEGRINYNKSDIRNSRCPRYAVEDDTNDGQRVRIIFAQCNDKTVVVTVIDLDKDYACNCPGDEKK